MTLVAICISTYKRPEFLRGLLASLAGLQLGKFTARVVVIDNDAAGSARSVVEAFGEALPGLIYDVEPERGIAAARNRSVATAARIGADYVAFVDDDEWVVPTWLASLVECRSRYDADAVQGPVWPEFEEGAPDWIVAGRFFKPRPHHSGEPLRSVATRNALIARSLLDRLEGPFDRRFDLTGGEDTHMSERLYRMGARMVWCDEAAAHERIPLSRASAAWLIRRHFRTGLTQSQVIRMVDPTPARLAIRIAKSVGNVGVGVLALLPSLFRGRVATVRAIRRSAAGLGGILGLVGFSYPEYRRTHGR